MEILAITPEDWEAGELETCNLLLSAGLSRLHIRKPNWRPEKIRAYIEKLDARFFHQISIHGEFEIARQMKLGGIHWKSGQHAKAFKGISSKSCHSLEVLMKEKANLDYAFLSPVFDSISKKGYNSTIDLESFSRHTVGFTQFPIYALGGVQPSNLALLSEAGFRGGVLMGAIWQQEKTIERLKVFEKCRQVATK